MLKAILYAGLLLALWSCGSVTPSPTLVPASPTPAAPAPSPTAPAPSPTAEPLAARVNGEGISLGEYQAELARQQKATGTELATEEKQKVLDDLIDQLLLAQGAAEAGFKLDDASLQDRIDNLVKSLGSAQALSDWMAAQGYTEESFRTSLARSAAAAWMRDRIAAGVPEKAEQVHARQILLFNAEQADQALGQLNAGKDFAALAAESDPVTHGDLGWFPQGYLLDPRLDEAVFKLQPGEHSPVIQTEAGFFILQVIERDPARTLDPGARLALQSKALEAWLAARRAQSKIEIIASAG